MTLFHPSSSSAAAAAAVAALLLVAAGGSPRTTASAETIASTECPDVVECRACPDPAGLLPQGVFLYDDNFPETPPECYCNSNKDTDAFDCRDDDNEYVGTTMSRSVEYGCGFAPCPPPQRAVVVVAPEEAAPIMNIAPAQPFSAEPSIQLVQVQQEPPPQPLLLPAAQPVLYAVDEPDDFDELAVTELVQDVDPPPPERPAPPPPTEIGDVIVLEQDWVPLSQCPCPIGSGKEFFITHASSAEDCPDPPPDGACGDGDLSVVQEEPPVPEALPAIVQVDPPPPEPEPEIFGGDGIIELGPQVMNCLYACPCPDNDRRQSVGMPPETFMAHACALDDCPGDDDLAGTTMCPPIPIMPEEISMVSPNPPMLCPCPNNPTGDTDGEWFQGYENLKECEDGPEDGECTGGGSVVTDTLDAPTGTAAHLDEVDCQCPHKDSNGQVVWYEIDPSHLLLIVDADTLKEDTWCPDSPPHGEGLECPPPPQDSPKLLPQEQPPRGGPPPGKGKKGPPAAGKKGPPGRASVVAAGPGGVAARGGRGRGPPPGKAKKIAATEAAAAAATGPHVPCTNAPQGLAFALCDKYCNKDGCPDIFGRRLAARQRSLRHQSLTSRALKSAAETCELLERRYAEVNSEKLDCEVV